MTELDRALEHHQAGRLKEAEAAYRDILAREPEHADALHLLGVIAHQSGEQEKAVALIEQAIGVRPEVAEYYNNVGEAYRALQQLDAAIAAYRQALTLRPGYAEARNNLGLALQTQGRLAEAEAAYREALALMPKDPEVHTNLGATLAAQGELDKAIAVFRCALALAPGYAEAHNDLGAALRQQGNLPEAIAAFRQVVTLNPKNAQALYNLAVTLQDHSEPAQAAATFQHALVLDPHLVEGHNKLGTALKDLGRIEEAIAALKRALALDPAHADAHNNLGVALQAEGALADAMAAYEHALALAPDHIGALGNLADVYERTNQLEDARSIVAKGLALCADDPLLNLTAAKCERHEDRVQEAVARLTKVPLSALRPAAAAAINYELGKLYDRSGDHARAFAHFSEGNRLLAQIARQRNIDKHTALGEIDTLDAQLSESWVRAWSADMGSVAEESPVFFIGFPRSGTTLLEQVLSSHPRLQTLEEKRTVDTIVNRIAALPSGYPSALVSLTAEDIAQLREAYFQVVDQALDRQPGCILIDKLPLNILRIPVIQRVFPHAKFIVSVRHPCDVCLSCFMQSFELNPAMANFLTLEDTTAFYVKVMALWQQCLRVLPLDYHLVRYEDLVERFEHETRRVLEFIGVGWDEAVLGYAEHARRRETIATPSYHEVTEPIFQRAKYRWHHYAKELEPYMRRLAPYIEYFGYRDA